VMEEFAQFLPRAQKFIDFVNNSSSPFHCVDSVVKILQEHGFHHLSEADVWASLKPNGKYYFTRNQGTIVAFCIGGKYQPGNGFNIIGAHTDSPNLKVKPNSAVQSQGFLQVGVECYGGGLWTTWFDRDLTLAGRVVVKRGDKFKSELVKVDRPLLRIPTLAIHLHPEQGTKLEINKQSNLLPVIATSVKSQLGINDPEPHNKAHHPLLLKILADELKCSIDDISDFDISVVDSQPAVIGGAFREFIFSPRLDNQIMSFCALMGLVEATDNETVLNCEKNILMAALFDHEEVGSQSDHGAASPIIMESIKRITRNAELIDPALRKSFVMSADMAHACHPNYSDKHDPNHRPLLHKGVVIKRNCNQRYATSASTAFHILELAKRNNIPVQDFVVRNDGPCGTTIGPIISGNTGIRTIDVGNPQLSMHSIREMCGTADITHAISLMKTFYEQFTLLDEQFIVD